MVKALTDIITYVDMSTDEARRPKFTPREIEILNKINTKVAGAETLNEVMNFFFDMTREIFPCDRLGLAFIRDDGRKVTSHWNKATYAPMLLGKGYSEILENSSLMKVLEYGTPRLITDLQSYLDLFPQSRSASLLVQEGVRSSMTCPLKVEDRVVGFLFRSSRMVNAYDKHQVFLHREVTERLSQAIEKAYRIEQLHEVNKGYMELLGFVAHELKSPLASIITDAKVLSEKYVGPLNEKQESKLKAIIDKSTYLMDLVKDYLDLARLEGHELQMNVSDLIDFQNEVIQPCIDIIQPQAMAKNMEIDLDIPQDERKVQCDPELMRVAVLNLLSNAVKYGRDNGNISILFQFTQSGIVFSVWNEGPGFPESEQRKLFQKFSRINTKELIKRKGTGLGLYTAWRMVRAHGGNITARSELGLWAEFVIRIPQPIERDNINLDL